MKPFPTTRYMFRFDDVSVNTDRAKLTAMIEFLLKNFNELTVMLAVSVGVHKMHLSEGLERERVFPSMLHTESDFRVFYEIDQVGVPSLIDEYKNRPHFQIASHGLVHVDHRLLSKKAQELSILTSCSLLNTKTFVPPFHKWNAKTKSICDENRIDLIQFQAYLWKHLRYHHFVPNETHYYLHTHDLTYEQFVGQFS